MNTQKKGAVLSQREILNILYADCYKSWFFSLKKLSVLWNIY